MQENLMWSYRAKQFQVIASRDTDIWVYISLCCFRYIFHLIQTNNAHISYTHVRIFFLLDQWVQSTLQFIFSWGLKRDKSITFQRGFAPQELLMHYYALFLNLIWPDVENILRKYNGLRRNLSTASQVLLNYWRRTCENLQAALLFVDFCKVFGFKQRKDGGNTTNMYPRINCYSYNMLYKKHESSGFIWWRHRFRWHCRWNLAKRYISIIYVYNLPRLHSR